MEAIERSKRSSDLILIRLFLLLLFLFFAQSKDLLKNAMPSSSSRMILSSSMSPSMEVDSNEPSSSQFDADEHEAPNGPNPISNRILKYLWS
ncbi:hypothetical protein KFK09_002994 [Dendrobium nobile]|uniref:Uncharacterized protein n=1 Tax=Dendrobium nobile TaxID=94219 RepID=A0A8T3C372_DENNO|nr:hypothetical protein KFK09_002994 [Dendrobium nobile]